MKVRTGATLIELIVALVIFSLLCALVVSVFRLSQRSMREFQHISRAQRSCGQGFQKIGDELTRAASSHFRSDGSGYIFPSTRPLSGNTPAYSPTTGQLLWSSYVALSLESEGKLVRRQLPVAGGPLPLGDIAIGDVPSLLQFAPASPKQLATEVTRFLITRQGVFARVELTCQTHETPKTEYTLQSTFTMQ